MIYEKIYVSLLLVRYQVQVATLRQTKDIKTSIYCSFEPVLIKLILISLEPILKNGLISTQIFKKHKCLTSLHI